MTSPLPNLLALGTVLSSLLALNPPGSTAGEPRTRKWLVRYVTQPISDTPRNRRYLEKIDRAKLLGLLDRDWLQHGEDSAKGRTQATLIGQMAFAYRTRGTRWHNRKDLLDEIRAGFRGFLQHQNEEGRFVWPKEGRWEHQAHEHVWRLEPLLLAYIWVQEDLTADERERWLAMLKRSGEYLIRHLLTEPNNRGAVWCAGTALCGVYFEDDRYLKLVEQHAPRLIDKLLADTGEVIETQGGGGPDANYSYVGFAYAYMYRLLTGADDLDERLLRSMRWLVLYSSLSGAVLAPGASTRRPQARGDVEVVLPALERYSADDPFLAHVADEYLKHCGNGGYGAGGLTVNSLIWGLLEQRGAEPSAELPSWFRNHARIYEWPHVHYLLVSRPGYQTAITFRSPFALRGLQTFACTGEPALVQASGPGLGNQSVTEAGGLNLSREDVPRGPDGWEIWMQAGEPRPEWGSVAPVTVVTRRKSLWTCYALTPSSLVVVCGGAEGPIRTVWVLGAGEQASLDESARSLKVPGRRACLHFLRGTVALKGSGALRYLEVRADGGPSAFGLSDQSFHFGKYDAGRQELQFSDASGRYRLDLSLILNSGGNINRTADIRLTTVEK